MKSFTFTAALFAVAEPATTAPKPPMGWNNFSERHVHSERAPGMCPRFGAPMQNSATEKP